MVEQAGFLCPPWKADSSPGLAWLPKKPARSGAAARFGVAAAPGCLVFYPILVKHWPLEPPKASKSREGRLAKVSRVPHCAWLCEEVRLMGTGGPENAH